ncbi:acyl carrier protein [Cohnella endophytica]|uniref:acyl carrier protein n=1 Tax=Cohnella endophytica TaxID=2419778 RepID=UPI001314F704|nr:phosphopantetheine-binding protein [Cohnella endophytica]
MQINIETCLKALILRNSLIEITYESIDENTDLINDLALDSMAIVNMFADIEAEFQIEVDIDSIKNPILEKFQYLKEYVLEQKKKGG